MIRIVLLEDSDFQREALLKQFSKEGDIQVVAAVADGRECLRLVPALKPNVVVVDGQLPGLSGPEVTEKLLELYPVPIVLFTASPEEFKSSAERSGAVAVVSKSEDFQASYVELVKTVRLMRGLRVIRRRNYRSHLFKKRHFMLIASSSGGPRTVEQLLRQVRPDTGVSAILVQHLTQEGTSGFLTWLREVTDWRCELVTANIVPEPGTLYVGLPGRHLLFNDRELYLGKASPQDHFAPSADRLFESFARSRGNESLGIVLSGMGADGARGLLELRLAGAVTVVEDPSTAAVAGMPESAIMLGAATHIVDSRRVGETVSRLLSGQAPGR